MVQGQLNTVYGTPLQGQLAVEACLRELGKLIADALGHGIDFIARRTILLVSIAGQGSPVIGVAGKAAPAANAGGIHAIVSFLVAGTDCYAEGVVSKGVGKNP